MIIPPPTTGGNGIVFSGHPSGCPSVRCLPVNTYFAWRDISVLSRRISI